MRRKLELLKLQIKSAFLSIPKIILGTIVTAVLVIAISTCIGIATAQDSDMRMKVAVVYPDYDDTENSDSADNNKEFRYIKMAFNYVSEIDTIKNVCTFEYTDRQQAIDGLRNNYYVMAIIVPENMISDIMSGENTPVEVVCQSEGVNNTSMIFREMVRALTLQLQRRGYIHLTICSMVCLRITGACGVHMRMSLMTYIFRMHLTEAYTLRQEIYRLKKA